MQIWHGENSKGRRGFDEIRRRRRLGDLGQGAGLGRERKRKKNGREMPLGAGFMRPPQGHRTLFTWHRTRPVTTGLMRREVCILALHRTMALASGASGHAK